MWDPSLTAPGTMSEDVDQGEAALEGPRSHLSLREFDVGKILAEGSLLLSSSGNEYGKASNLSAEELARAQQDALSKLGLGFGPTADNDLGLDVGAELAAGVDDDQKPNIKSEPDTDMSSAPTPLRHKPSLPPPRFKNDGATSLKTMPTLPASASPPRPDLSKSPEPKARTPAPAPKLVLAPEPSPPAAIAAAKEDDPYAGLSAREKNKLKRKRKSEAKTGGPLSTAPPAKIRAVEASTSSSTPVAEASTKSDVVVIDPGAKAREREGGEVQIDLQAAKERAEMEVKVGEWPWRGTVDRLAVSLLS